MKPKRILTCTCTKILINTNKLVMNKLFLILAKRKKEKELENAANLKDSHYTPIEGKKERASNLTQRKGRLENRDSYHTYEEKKKGKE